MPLFGFYPEDNSLVKKEQEKKVFRYSLLFPLFFIGLCWALKISESFFTFQSYRLGIYPLDYHTLTGILTAPLIHGSYGHLMANTLPFLILAVALNYFYRGLAYRIFWIIYFCSGIFVWIVGRPAWHIGASGLIYGMASFLFFSGIFRNQLKLLTIALIVAFLYGSMFWGIFPLEDSLSWEGHLGGAFTGFFLALIYQHRGPERQKFQWEEESEEEKEEEQNSDTDEVNQDVKNSSEGPPNPLSPEK